MEMLSLIEECVDVSKYGKKSRKSDKAMTDQLLALDVIKLCIVFIKKKKKSFTVDADEIKRLGKRFRKLDLDNSGALSVEEFMSLPELQQNPLVQRVIDIFDTDGNGEVDFKGRIS